MYVYRLAVCEDDESIRGEICRLCEEILVEEKIDYEVYPFASAKELKNSINQGDIQFQVLLLDIEMDELTGMELAEGLRKDDNRISIIFVTGAEEYIKTGYRVQPIDFLLKPVKKEELRYALMTDYKLNHTPEDIVVQNRGRTARFLLSKIQYVESENHSLMIHQVSGKKDTVYMSLTDFEKMLPADKFARSHNSFLVNLGYVEEVRRTTVRLLGGEEIPVGRKYYKDFQKTFVSYLNR
ncbi:MAG: LytTR family DNA-binding domain-containing protein [Lachnospiraceae bacterium]|nr:LytTR family DNA-binding domain-containing protein [Lachnospiraceae bacterium]